MHGSYEYSKYRNSTFLRTNSLLKGNKVIQFASMIRPGKNIRHSVFGCREKNTEDNV
jgi:hypothetical protein